MTSMNEEDYFVWYQRSQLTTKEKNMLYKVLKFLSGKKTIIVGMICTTTAFLVLKMVIDADTATYINAMTLLVFGSASYATKSVVYPESL